MLSTHPCHQTHCIRRFDTHSSGEGLLTGHFLHYKSLMEWGGTSVTKFRLWGGHSGWYGVPTNPPITEHGPPTWYHGSDNNGYCTEHHSYYSNMMLELVGGRSSYAQVMLGQRLSQGTISWKVKSQMGRWLWTWGLRRSPDEATEAAATAILRDWTRIEFKLGIN